MTELSLPRFLVGANHRQQSDFGVMSYGEFVEVIRNPPAPANTYKSIDDLKDDLPWLAPFVADAKTKDEVLKADCFTGLICDDDSGSNTLESLTKAIANLAGDCAFAIYSTASSSESARRFRIIIPAQKPFTYAQLLPFQLALVDYLGLDDCTERATQISYQPVLLEGYEFCINASERLFDVTGESELSKMAAFAAVELEEQEAAEQKFKAERKAFTEPIQASGRLSPINEYNRAFELERLLREFRYKKIGRKWLPPDSSSGSPGVVILPSKLGYSHHTSTQIQGCFDAFELFKVHEHGADETAALKAAGAMLSTADGTSITQHNQAIYRRDNLPADIHRDSEPQPLGCELLPVQKFHPELLPDALRPWICDKAKRIQCPIDFLAVGAIVSAASLIAGTVSIYPKKRDNWRVVPNLWGCLIGRPSSGKSPALEVLKPLKDLEQEQLDRHESEQYLVDAESLEMNERLEVAKTDLKKAVKTGSCTMVAKDEIARLNAQIDFESNAKARRYVVNDSTHEKLGELLADNPQGLLLVRDELTGLLASLGRDDRQEARAFYLEAFNGTGHYTFDRIKRGTITIDPMVLSLVGGIQPTKLAPFVWNAITQGQQDDGLIQRLQLAVYPDIDGSWQNYDEAPDELAESKAMAVFQKLDLLATSVEDGISLRFSEDGQEVFDEWRHQLEQEARSGEIHPAIEAHLIKYRSLMPSLALIFHVVDTGITEPVSEGAALMACKWCAYLKSHMNRIYSGAVSPELINARAILKKRSKLPHEFTARDVQRKNWAGMRTKQDIQAALDELSSTYHLFSRDEKRGNYLVTIYRWNPRLSSE